MKKLLIVAIASFFLSGCNRLDQHQPLTSQIIKFSEGESISEEIKSTRNNLNTVSICIRNPQRELIPLTFTLTEGTTVIRTLSFSSGNIENEDCTKFKFEPITDSEGKIYTAAINSVPPSKDKLIPTVLTVEKHEGVTHYKTFYYQSAQDVIKESVTQFSNRLAQDLPFMIVWLGMLAYVAIKIVRSKRAF